MRTLTDWEVLDFCSAHTPILHFAKGETFLPINAEYWLAHRYNASWNSSFPDTGQGTALYVYDDGYEGVLPECRRSPPPLKDWKSLPPVLKRGTISLNLSDKNYLGSHDRTTRSNQFLSFGGWLPESTPDGTSIEKGAANFPYLEAAFAPLAGYFDALRESDTKASVPPPKYPPATTLGISSEVIRLEAPVVYCELALASSLVPKDSSETHKNLATLLGSSLALNYYYFYPALYHATGGVKDHMPVIRKAREGQWEVISLFFTWDGEADLRNLGHPEWLAFSQSWDANVGPLVCEPNAPVVISWEEVLSRRRPPKNENIQTPAVPSHAFINVADNGRPLVYVALGTHANIAFDPYVTPAVADPEAIHDLGDAFRVAGLWYERYFPDPIAAILQIFHRLCKHREAASGAQHTPDARPPAGNDPFIPGRYVSGIESASEVLGWKLKIITSLNPEYASSRPAWWDYSGLWGVRVDDIFATDPNFYWGNGTWRTLPDETCFSKGDPSYRGSLAWRLLQKVIDESKLQGSLFRGK